MHARWVAHQHQIGTLVERLLEVGEHTAVAIGVGAPHRRREIVADDDATRTGPHRRELELVAEKLAQVARMTLPDRAEPDDQGFDGHVRA